MFRASLLASLVLLGCPGQQVRPTPEAVPDELEVSPGLRPEEVQKAIDAARPLLEGCQRLDLPDTDDATLDDRVLLDFTMEPDKEEPIHVTRAASVYLDEHCLSDWADVISLPPLKYVRRAEITWKSHWKSTAERRQQTRAHIARNLQAFCDQFQTRFAHAQQVGWKGEPDPVKDAAAGVLNGPDVHPIARNALQAMVSVNPGDQHAIFQATAKEIGAPDCPALDGYFEKIPEGQ
ncbi:MAG: hypothetical protein ACJ790_07385 [Myxococcaceae bacterium]